MLQSVLVILSTSYFAWYLEHFEMAMIYPFDATYMTPDVSGEPRLKETRLKTEDNEELIVWRAPAAEGQPTLIYFPGNAGGLKDRVERFGDLLDRGYGLTALAYRGSSGSSGQPNENLLILDAKALALMEKDRPLILYGESLGTAVAIELSTAGIGDALVLEAPFTTLSQLVANQYPDEELDHLLTQRWQSIELIPQVQQPLLVIHGTHDRIVPISMGLEIYQGAGSQEKQFVEVNGRGHNGLWTPRVLDALFVFVEAR
jgi:fermentation-respiration switch protein FrsA (DUF1100 family)